MDLDNQNTQGATSAGASASEQEERKEEDTNLKMLEEYLKIESLEDKSVFLDDLDIKKTTLLREYLLGYLASVESKNEEEENMFQSLVSDFLLLNKKIYNSN
jgi:hypothetical protein